MKLDNGYIVKYTDDLYKIKCLEDLGYVAVNRLKPTLRIEDLENNLDEVITDYEIKSLNELREIAKNLKVKNYIKLSKKELITAIGKA